MPVTPERAGPYAPAAVIVDLIERYRSKGLPVPVNADVLARAGVSASLVARTLQALVTLDLVDAEGRPTSALEGMRLAPEAEYQERMVEWLNNTYADALQFVDPATDDEEAVRDAFRKYNPIGQQSRMVTLFMGLFRRAGVAPEKTPTGGAARKKQPSQVKPRAEKPKADTTIKQPPHPDPGAGKPQNQQQSPGYMDALLAKFPSFDPTWPDEIKAKWFEGFETFMKGVNPK